MSKRTFHTFNPRNNCNNDKLFLCNSKEEANILLVKAEQAFQSLQKKTNQDISALFIEIGCAMEEEKLSIKNVYKKESGLSSDRFEREFNRTIHQLNLFSSHLKSQPYSEKQEIVALTKDKILKKKKIGIGPVLIIGAGNFPLAYSTIGGDSIAALAAKNPIVVKAHPHHTGTSLTIAKIVIKILRKLNFPEGTFTHLIDDTYDLGCFLAKHKTIKAIGFTGSLKGGQAFMKYGFERPNPIPVFAEMGSSNPVVLLKSVLKQTNTSFPKEIAQSICSDSGQFCTKPGLLFVPKTEGSKSFIEDIKNEIFEFENHPMLHPEVKINFDNKIDLLKKSFRSDQLIKEKEHKDIPKHYPRKSILVADINALKEKPFVQDEVFGPHLSIILYEDEHDLPAHIKNLRGQLTLSVFGDFQKERTPMESIIEIGSIIAGRVIINGLPTGVEVSIAMQHGGPFPASSDSRYTAVGPVSIDRFQRSVTFQNNRI